MGSRGIAYADVEVEPMKKAELKWGDWNQVPVYVDVDGNAMDESNDILSTISIQRRGIYSLERDMTQNKIVGWNSATRYSANLLLL
ncbi:MAG: hypothetical protein Ct9H90mP14_1010 [Methanobacteriota archaeon]|nr:MAG: hypothetical protein Ct9H90mP14_1010 [Euryarchaeota archaeon]